MAKSNLSITGEDSPNGQERLETYKEARREHVTGTAQAKLLQPKSVP